MTLMIQGTQQKILCMILRVLLPPTQYHQVQVQAHVEGDARCPRQWQNQYYNKISTEIPRCLTWLSRASLKAKPKQTYSMIITWSFKNV